MKIDFCKIIGVLLILVATACDRSGVYEEFQNEIPWGFCVVAVSDDNMTQPVAGATVEIYTTKEDREAGTNVLLTKQTDNKGEAHFTLGDFDKNNKGAEQLKGNYYLKVTKDNITVEETTRYLLMNSGETYHWIVIK